jgi:hypothetical protein
MPVKARRPSQGRSRSTSRPSGDGVAPQSRLKIGDSLRRKIDEGLANSRFGVVVFSRPFLAKGWTQYELDGLVTRQVHGEQNLPPIWHDITRDEIKAASPSLVEKFALLTAQFGIEDIPRQIAEVVHEQTEDSLVDF